MAQIRQCYAVLFRNEWAVWVGGALFGILNVALFFYDQPWTTLDGALNWGDSILGALGVVRARADPPLIRTGSVINLGLLAGAFAAALLARQFSINIGPKRELLKGAVGGLLLGTGAAIARGCNIGGFFSATSAFGANGLAMALGLTLGAFAGVRFLLWEVEHSASSGAVPSPAPVATSRRRIQPYLGALVLLGLIVGAALYEGLGIEKRALILLFGAALGIISQRSRVCFVQGFREPFLTGDTRHTRAMLLGLLISMVGFAAIEITFLEKEGAFIRETFWMGSLIGGVIFGFGMVLAGGCGAGSIWRAGEGNVKLMVAVAGYALSASFVRDVLVRTGLQQQLGVKVFLPEVFGGWTGAIAVLAMIIAVWYAITRWNQASRKLAAV
ncbi:MAG: YeeE/YedE family protein [Chloroflexi bacterium]|nr:YeeE/YedE family protein [Chloroflexota bacterium]